MDPLDVLRAIVRRTFAADLDIAPMPSGASTRRYFRLTLPNGKSAIAIHAPDRGVSDEAHRPWTHARWPFLAIRDLLAAHGIEVPQIFAENLSEGWLILEDLGDLTLAKFLKQHPERREELYCRVVSDLVRAQASVPAALLRPFDFSVARWELEHFYDWAVDARGRTFSPDDRAQFAELADVLARRVAELPTGFVHRDYQSRNIMVVGDGDRLVWIDFQDAVLGPRAYDLASLLNDSHQDFDRAFVEARLSDYANEAGLDHAARASLGEEFDVLTVQRKLKDAGRFVFVERERNNPAFSKFVGPTIGKAGRALERLGASDPRMKELHALLARTLEGEI